MLVTCGDNTLPGSVLDDQGQEHISPHDYSDVFHIINYNNVIIPQNSKYGYD